MVMHTARQRFNYCLFPVTPCRMPPGQPHRFWKTLRTPYARPIPSSTWFCRESIGKTTEIEGRDEAARQPALPQARC